MQIRPQHTMCCNSLGSGVNNVMKNVASLVGTLPCNRHVIVVTFVLRRHQTNVRIEIQELENGVRATGLLCLLGITVGIGSVLIYRLYTRFFASSVPPCKSSLSPTQQHKSTRRKRHVSDLCSSSIGAGTQSNVVTPDSGIVADTSTPEFANGFGDISNDAIVVVDDEPKLRTVSGQNQRRHFSDFAEFHRRRSHTGSLEDILLASNSREDDSNNVHYLRRSWAVADWLAHADLTAMSDDDVMSCTASDIFATETKNLMRSRWSSADHGFASELMTESAELTAENLKPVNCQSIELLDLSVSTQRVFELGLQLQNNSLLRKRGLSESGVSDGGGPWCRRRRRRRQFSLASGASESDCDYRESLVSKGFSVDLGEDLDGILTPFQDGMVDPSTVAGMESLQKALCRIQQDIEDMNQKFDGLRSTLIPHQSALDLNPAVMEEWSLADEDIRSDGCRSEAQSRDCLSSEREVDGESCCGGRADVGTTTEFIWDYQSDLVLAEHGSNPGFVTQRPFIGQNCGFTPLSAMCFTSASSDAGTEPSICSANDAGLDMYIDDDFGAASNQPVEDDLIPDDVFKPGFSSRCSENGNGLSYASNSSSSYSLKSPQVDCQHCCKCNSRAAGSFDYSHSDSCCYSCPAAAASVACHRPFSAESTRRSSVHNNQTCLRRRQLFSGSACNNGFGENISCAGLTATYDLASHHSHCCQQQQPHQHQQSTRLSSPTVSCDHCNNPITSQHPKSCSSSNVRVVGDKKDICQVLDTVLSANHRTLVARKSCQDVIHMWNVQSVRYVGDDFHCAIRAVLYSSLLENLPILSHSGNLNDCCRRLVSSAERNHRYLRSWNFATAEFLYRETEVIEKLLDCVRCLFEQVELIGKLSSYQQRDQYLAAVLNGDPDIDRRMIEGAKVLMILQAISACEDSASGVLTTRSPLFLRQIFGPSSSVTAATFFHNHINCVDEAPILCIQPMELSFLAYTFGIRIQVFHSSCVAKCDYLRHYPDEGADQLPVVRILEGAEKTCFHVPVA